jgi:hypothetical protein
MFATVSVHSTMGKGAARWWRALWLVWVVVAWAAARCSSGWARWGVG